MAEKICNGDCLKCSLQQQIYCSAQFAYENMRERKALTDRLTAIEESVKSFTQEPVINPLSGAGVEKIAPETKIDKENEL